MNDSLEKEKLHQEYVMPAEWSDHSATMLIWPHNRETWPGKRLDAVEKVYCKIVHTLLKYEPVLLFTDSGKVRQRALSILGDTHFYPHHFECIIAPVNDVWARDSGPIFVKNDDNSLITNWEFNSWGGKYEPWDDDNKLPEKISSLFSIPQLKTGVVLEGGSIETNGQGLFVTTESVLLNKNRNPNLSKTEIEGYMRRYLGAEKVIWLNRGLAGDDTDGHIDDLTRFVNKNTLVTTISDDRDNPNYETLIENMDILMNSTGEEGDSLNIIQIPLPETRVQHPTVDGSDHVPSSYANFYIVNGAVLLPMYDERTDQQMLDLFSGLFPGRTIEGIACSDLVWGQGSIHCITQQLYGLHFNRA